MVLTFFSLLGRIWIKNALGAEVSLFLGNPCPLIDGMFKSEKLAYLDYAR